MADANSLNNLLVWADIPVADLDRAASFYAGVLQMKITKENLDGTPFCFFHRPEGNGGCLIREEDAISATGMLIYFNVNGRIKEALALVAPLGGQVLQGLHAIGPHGYRAIILDSEGNRLALHATVDD